MHFFLNSGFYNESIIGKRMLFMCIVRSFFIICVPMFITLTGYLMNKKEFSKKYYNGLFHTLIIYFICSVVYFVFSYFYFNQEVNIQIFFQNLLSFNGTRYAWYIEMYIGLFLMIQFLNLVFNHLKDKKHVWALLLTFSNDNWCSTGFKYFC